MIFLGLKFKRTEMNDDWSKELEKLGIDDYPLETELEGIKIPSQFNISLKGQTDQGVFDSLSGILFITASSSESQYPFLITLVINPDLFGKNGWIYLNTEENFQKAPNIKIQVKSRQVCLEIISNQNTHPIYTLGTESSSPDFNRRVLIEKGILTFTVDGDNISGEIKASGIYLPNTNEHFSDFEKLSTYEAKLMGKIPKSSIVEKLKNVLASSFKKQSFSSDKNNNVNKSWQLPSFVISENLSPFDLQELRYLGHDLALEHQYKPASVILNYVITTYLQQNKAFESGDLEKEREQESCLISAAFSLNFLLDCYFQLEDYPQLLKSLDDGLEIQRLLGPEASSSRLFQQFMLKISNLLISNAERLAFMENGYKNWQKMVSGNLGMIGINLEKDNEHQQVIITAIEEGQPADLAGILPQDVILKIDGKIIQGLDEQQVLKKIQGQPETPVTLTIQRNNQELEFQLTRTKIEMSSLQRQAKINQTLTSFSHILRDFQKRLAYYLNQIHLLIERIAQGQEEPVAALLSISGDIENLLIQFSENINVFINQGKEGFNQQTEALDDLEFILAKFKNFDPKDNLDIKELDAREERMMQRIENAPELTSLEKQLFKAYYTTMMSLLTFKFEVKCELNLLKKNDVKKLFAENRKRAKDITSNLSERIEIWRARLKEDLAKIEALEQGQAFFNKALQFLISLNYLEEALVISEKSRARAFADLLSERFSVTTNSPSIVPSIAAKSPTLEQIKKMAQEQKVTLIEYAIIENLESQTSGLQLLIWVVQPTGKIEFKSINISQTINNIALKNLIKQARSSIGVEEKANSLDFEPSFRENNQYFYPHFRQLYDLLIEPIIEFLPDDSTVPLIFIPQKFLFEIPFAALQDKKGDFLIQKYIILTVPSIQLLDLTHQPKTEKQETFKNALIVGNPTMPSVPQEKGGKPKQLSELLISEVEAQVIASFFNNQALIGDSATKFNILQQMPQTRLIHLATHGIVDDLRPLGIIALAPSENDNGILATEEILEMFGQPQKPILPCELLVLSACHTGRGKITGDGVIGLSRSLMVAGASRVIVSLWQAYGLATAFLMIKFYEMLKDYVQLEPADVAKVLNQAQKWLMGLSCAEAEQELEKLKPYIYQALAGEKPRFIQAYITQYQRTCSQSSYPFASPKYWAALTTIGL